MSYLAQPTSKTDYGVVQVGGNINVTDGIISLAQDIGPNANVTFYNANVTHQLVATNANITTQLVATNANITTQLVASNANVTTLVATTGNISTLTSSNANINTLTTNTANVVTFTATNANVTGNLYAAGNLVVTDVTPNAGPGISLSNVISNGYHASFTVNNTGVLKLTAGTGIALSANTGNIVVSTTGTSYINVIGVTGNYSPTLTDEYIGVYSANAVTVNLPVGVEGRVYIIKDEYGQGSGKITLQPQPGDKIDNSNNYIISVPFQAAQIVYRAGTWRLI